MRVTLKAIHDELQRLSHDVHLEKGDGYFYFWGALRRTTGSTKRSGCRR